VGACGKPGVRLVGVHFQRDGFTGAAVQEVSDVSPGEPFQNQLLMLRRRERVRETAAGP
jgi:hypothetical protein